MRPSDQTSIMPVDCSVILACFINEDHLWGSEVCIDILFPLLPKVFIMLSSCPAKELKSHLSIMLYLDAEKGPWVTGTKGTAEGIRLNSTREILILTCRGNKTGELVCSSAAYIYMNGTIGKVQTQWMCLGHYSGQCNKPLKLWAPWDCSRAHLYHIASSGPPIVWIAPMICIRVSGE